MVSFYGASNLQTILAQSTPYGLNMRVPALELLLGAVPEKEPRLAQLAIPCGNISMPMTHRCGCITAIKIRKCRSTKRMSSSVPIKRTRLPVRFDVVYGGMHGGAEFYSQERLLRLSK